MCYIIPCNFYHEWIFLTSPEVRVQSYSISTQLFPVPVVYCLPANPTPATTNSFSISTVPSFRKCNINGITQSMIFHSWLFTWHGAS